MLKIAVCFAAVISSGVCYPLLAEETAPAEEESVSLKEAITQGNPILSFRYRYEDVTDDAVGDKHARASTLRTAFGYRTLAWKGLSFTIEGENVAVIGSDLYNNAGVGDRNNGVRERPVVADPAGTEVNQAFGQFELGKSKFQLGREEIVLGDARFVGNVGWRQNHQSFDAFTFANSSLSRLTFFYSFVDNVNRINFGNAEMASHLGNVGIDLGVVGKLTVYGYLLDYDSPASYRLSSQTIGVELAGKWDPEETFSLLYELEYADQSDYGDNPGTLDAQYTYLMIGAALKPVSLRLGWEVLGGSEADGQFNTPLATLHKWNGWADKFLSTPVRGLEDLYLQVDGKFGNFGWMAVYHDFGSDEGSLEYGSELDLQGTWKSPWQQVFGLKGAVYDADEFAADTTKLWFFTTYSI